MFSTKWRFSLGSLIVLLALGFALMPALAHKAEKGNSHLVVDFSLDSSVIDVSSESTATVGIEEDVQVDSGRVRGNFSYPRPIVPRATGTGNDQIRQPFLTFLVEFNKQVPLTFLRARDSGGTVANQFATVVNGGIGFGLDDIVISAFDEFGRQRGSAVSLDAIAAFAVTNASTAPTNLTEVKAIRDGIAKLVFTNPGGTTVVAPGELAGRQFTLEVYLDAVTTITTMFSGVQHSLIGAAQGGDFEITNLIFSFKNHSVTEAKTLDYQLYLQDPGNYKDGDINGSLKDDATKLAQGPEFPYDIRIDLVDVDEGNPRYRDETGTLIPAESTSETLPTQPTNLTTIDLTADPYVASAAGVNPSGYPNVVSITRLRGTSDDITTPLGYGVTPTDPATADHFDVKIVLTERPAEFTVDHINVDNGTVISVDAGLPFGRAAEGDVTNTPPAGTIAAVSKAAVTPPASEGSYTLGTGDGADLIPEPTGRDNRYWQYRVRIDPTRATTDDVIITVKKFDDRTLPQPKSYTPLTERQRKTIAATGGNQPLLNNRLKQGREILSVPVVKAGAPPTPKDIFKSSADAKLPHEKFINENLVIPANGYLVLASGTYGQAGFRTADNTALHNNKTAVEKFDPPYPGNDFANYLRNGATIKLVYKDIADNTAGKTSAVAEGAILINEIMWGYDRGLDNRAYTEGQWIELHNTTAVDITIDKQEFALVFGTTSSLDTGGTVVDTFSNNPTSGYWQAKGNSGVSSPDPVVKVGVAVEKEGQKEETQVLDRDVTDVVSMSRVTGGTDGTAELSWAKSILPSANYATAGRIGTPGAENSYDSSAQDAARKAADDATKAAADATKAAADAAKAAADAAAAAAAGSVATKDDIGITEIMVDTDGGRLPQWIELTNLSAGTVNLNGWTAVIENAVDADVLGGGAPVTIKLDGLVLGVGKGMQGDQTGAGEGQSALLVAWATRHSSNLDQAGISARTVNLATQLEQTARYQLLSYMGFTISLMPPQDGAIATYGDVVGNLGMDWDIMMAEGGRSSLIRREMDAKDMETMGTAANGWRLASATDLIDGPTSWYGSDEDAGTPGYDSGGPLPVELSTFYPARDRLTGQVVIKWETQSELNNAGFFIKRSQQRRGNFVVINPTMVPGAGTTSEKQSYTYTDTSAKPNVVYYYQIEDVSLDGQRQTLTNGIRLRGHIGAAGKLTTKWGELKSQE